VVIPENTEKGIRIVIIVYQPNLEEWDPGFKKRRRP